MGIRKNLQYSPLLEDDVPNAWEKSTVLWVIKNEKKVRNLINKFGNGNVQEADVSDIYMEIITYFYQSSDYDIDKAIDLSHSDKPVSLAKYVSSCIKYCVIRHVAGVKHRYEIEKHDIEDSDTLSLVDLTVSKEQIEVERTLDDILSSNTHMRYMYGTDMFQVLFIQLLCRKYDKDEVKTEEIFSTLGITESVLNKFDTYTEDGPIVEIARAIVKMSIDDALEILERYVYSANNIKRAII